MSRLYGIVSGQAYTNATRTGSRTIATTAKSWDFAVRVDMWDDQTVVVEARDIETGDCKTLYRGSLEDLFGRKAPARYIDGRKKPVKVKQTKAQKLTRVQQRVLDEQQQLIATLFGDEDEAAEVVAS